MVESVAAAGSQATVARDRVRFTSARSTPARVRGIRSTSQTHAEQWIPSR